MEPAAISSRLWLWLVSLSRAIGLRFLFVGTARGLESRLVPDAGFQLELIEVGPLNRISLATRLRTLAQLPLSLFTCRRILHKFRPGAVLGVGGVCFRPGDGRGHSEWCSCDGV